MWGSLYLDRFNLNPEEIDLVRAAQSGTGAGSSTAEQAWANYVRFLFSNGNFYQLSALSSEKFLYVAEVASKPGREKIAEGEAIGRALSISWYELVEDAMGAKIVKPVNGEQGRIHFLSFRIHPPAHFLPT